MPTISELFAQAVEFHRSGNLRQARDLYCQILDTDPRHADALHLLGMVVEQAGEHELAVDFLRAALALDADDSRFHNHLGAIFHAQGKKEDAIASYRQALRLSPDYGEAHTNLGIALREQGQEDEALACFHEALRLEPDNALAHRQLGELFKQQGRLEEASASFRAALRVQPSSIPIRNNLGIALMEQGKLDEAQDCFQEALKLHPDQPELHNNLGTIFRHKGRLPEALASYRQALRLKPDYVEAHNNLGSALMEQARLNEAGPGKQHGLAFSPGAGASDNNRGVSFAEKGNLEEALACFRRALKVQPDSVEAHTNLGNGLLNLGRLKEAQDHYQQALHLQPDNAYTYSNLLFSLNYDPHADPETVCAEHRHWGNTFGQPKTPPLPHANDPNPERRLRVGYVSPDLRGHPVAHFFEPILANHDAARVEAVCYAEVPAPDAVTARLRALAHGWHSTSGLTDQELAARIRADGIDILVDLAGHTANHRLGVFTYQPAPIQITYLGYPNTTGLTCIDYRFTDAVLDPPGEPEPYTEKLVRLADGLCRYAPPAHAPDIAPLPARLTQTVTFGSLHNLAKLNAHVFDLWCKVLETVPSSRLLIFRSSLTSEMKTLIHQEFIQRGIRGDRVEVRHSAGERGYLGTYDEIDVTLDVFPWTGHATSCESLWMGVPVITLAGDRSAWRLTASILTCLGLSDLIVDSPEKYVALAEQLSADLDLLSGLRSSLRRIMRQRLCVGQPFTRHLEETYRTLWKRWCEGN